MSNPSSYPNLGTSPLTIIPGTPSETPFQFDPTSLAAAGAEMYLNFVVCGDPPANNMGGQPLPTVTVQVQSDVVGQTYTTVVPNVGFGTTVSTGDGGLVDIELVPHPSGQNGVFQLIFAPHGSYSLSAKFWKVQFTTSTAAPTIKLTFVVDSADTVLPWIGLPPTPLDFGRAIGGLTLDGPSGGSKQIIAGSSLSLSLPIGNYGTGPLSITGVSPTAATNGLHIPFSSAFSIPPGSMDNTLVVQFQAPAAERVPVTPFTIKCSDPLAPDSGGGPHQNVLSLTATTGNFEVVLVLDQSGSMATNDAGGMTRWAQLQLTVTGVLHDLVQFCGASPSNTLGVVLYPGSGAGGAQVVPLSTKPLPVASIDSSLVSTYDAAFAGLTTGPVDSTPMVGTAGNPGGIYKAAGLPTDGETVCGLFVPMNQQPASTLNYRWLVLMSDGFSNVGDDPNTIAPSYFSGRNVHALTVAYGDPSLGQVGAATLQNVAKLSVSSSVSGTPPNYFAANQNGAPSAQLLSTFLKTNAQLLGLDFAVDPDAVLAPGTTANRHQVVVTDNDRTAAFVVAFGSLEASRMLHVQLLTPLGETVTPATAASIGMTYYETALSKSYYASAATLTNGHASPRYGTWTIVVTRGDSTGASVPGALATTSASTMPTLSYAYHVTIDSSLTLFVGSTAATHYAGETIELFAALSVNGRPLTDAHVQAQITDAGQGFDNWLAGQSVTAAEYAAALKALQAQGLQDVQALFVKTKALAAKGLTFPGLPSRLGQTMQLEPRTGTYRTAFAGTTTPGTYQFLVSATGQDNKGNPYTRQRTYTAVVTAKPDDVSSLVSIAYQVVSGQMQATLRVWPQDRFGNVFLVDPAISRAIAVVLDGGAVASGSLTWNLDASYTQVFTYPLTATPTISIVAGGNTILPKFAPPAFGKGLFVNQVVRFAKGREAKAGANRHTDPTKAFGDPSRKPLTDFVSLGGLGIAAFDIKGLVIHASAVTVFVAPDTSLRAYSVEVLPVKGGVGWVEVGRSRGVTETFSLVPKRHVPPNTTGWYIDVSGRLADETFDIRIPLAGRLHAPVDPLTRIGTQGIVVVRVIDLSNRVTNPDGTASSSPGVSLLGIMFAP